MMNTTIPGSAEQTHASGRILLIGGGHTHLELLRLARGDRCFLDRVTMIAKEPRNWYSGMASSWIEGIYSEEDISIDLKTQADAYNIPLVIGEVQSVDFQSKKLFLKNGDSFSYELASFDIGSLTTLPKESADWPSWYPVKPFSSLSEFQHRKTDGQLIVMGSGAAAMELAVALGNGSQNTDPVLLLTYPTGLMRGHPERVRRSVIKQMAKAGRVSILSDAIVSIEAKRIQTVHHDCACDMVLIATGPVAPPLFQHSGFTTDNKGYLLVHDTLQSLTSPHVFGAGDCVAIQGKTLEKTGVHAIRQAPVLLANLKAAMNEGMLKPYRTTKHHLAIFSTGGRTAVMQYGSLVLSGKIAWCIKHWIDWSYMQKHRHKHVRANHG